MWVLGQWIKIYWYSSSCKGIFVEYFSLAAIKKISERLRDYRLLFTSGIITEQASKKKSNKTQKF